MNLFEDGYYFLRTNKRPFKVEDIVYLVNSNCDFDYDNLTGVFVSVNCNGFKFEQECKIEILEEDISNYVPEKSCNGGAYAYATAKIVEIIE